MGTKVTILGQEPKEEKKTPIQILRYVTHGGSLDNFITSKDLPHNLKEIQLLPRLKSYNVDLFLCKRSNGSEFYAIGHFNDGVVE
jgi:hypothetical protein